jgi:hypothetical protein
MPYPATYCLAERDAEVAGNIVKDLELGNALRDYVRVSSNLMHDIDDRLAGVSGGQPVIVWGTGELTSKLLADTSLGRANIRAFVDSNPINHGGRLHGVPVLAPEALVSSTEPIVVASIIHHRSIVDAIRARGLNNPIVALTAESA